jgi:hypothetical protein
VNEILKEGLHIKDAFVKWENSLAAAGSEAQSDPLSIFDAGWRAALATQGAPVPVPFVAGRPAQGAPTPQENEMSEAKGEFPKICELCEKEIGSRIDLDWHGLGNCVPICETCNGSGIAKTGEPKICYTPEQINLMLESARRQALEELAAQGAPGTREPQFTAEELRSCIFTYADGQINFGVTLGRVNNVLRKKHRALAQPGAPTKGQAKQ